MTGNGHVYAWEYYYFLTKKENSFRSLLKRAPHGIVDRVQKRSSAVRPA